MLLGNKMASLKFGYSIVIIPIFFMSSSSHTTSSSYLDPVNVVNLSIYYETLSSEAAKFIVQDIPNLFSNGIISIINLRLVPWGNAYVNQSSKAVVCEHGPKECMLNEAHACAIDVSNDPNEYFKFIMCAEVLALNGWINKWRNCSELLGLSLQEQLLQCYDNGRGAKLALKYGNETSNLVPPLKSVPWVIVHGKPLEDDYSNFIKYVCEIYEGPNPPNICDQYDPLIINSPTKENSVSPPPKYIPPGLGEDDVTIPEGLVSESARRDYREP